MIFVTVGTQLPFDRLISAIDQWADRHDRNDVIAQTGPTGLRPARIKAVAFMDPSTFDRHFMQASLIVAHAGMGSILGALSAAKPILIMPRKATLGEHRNDHQLATANRFRNRPGIFVADDEQDLPKLLDDPAGLGGGSPIAAHASPELLQTIRDFINAS